MKSSIAIFKQNKDNTESPVSEKTFDTDREALQAVTEPGKYILYPVVELTAEDIEDLKK